MAVVHFSDIAAAVGVAISVVAVAIALLQSRSSSRSADAAEDSAASARRAADAAERSAEAEHRAADAAQQQLVFDRERAQREKDERAAEAAPHFAPLARTSPETFNLHLPSGPLSAHVVNRGASAAILESAVLRHVAGETPGGFLHGEPGPISGGVQSTLRAEPGTHVIVQFDVGDQILQGDGRPKLVLTYRAAEGAFRAEWHLELLRSASSPNGRPQWRAGNSRIQALSAT